MIIRTPYLVQPGFNEILVASTRTTIEVYSPAAPDKRIKLYGATVNGETHFDISGVVKALFSPSKADIGNTEGWAYSDGLLEGRVIVTDGEQSKEIFIINAVQRKYESLDLLSSSRPSLLTQRPVVGGVVKIPKYAGFPYGIGVLAKSQYAKEVPVFSEELGTPAFNTAKAVYPLNNNCYLLCSERYYGVFHLLKVSGSTITITAPFGTTSYYGFTFAPQTGELILYTSTAKFTIYRQDGDTFSQTTGIVSFAAPSPNSIARLAATVSPDGQVMYVGVLRTTSSSVVDKGIRLNRSGNNFIEVARYDGAGFTSTVYPTGQWRQNALGQYAIPRTASNSTLSFLYLNPDNTRDTPKTLVTFDAVQYSAVAQRAGNLFSVVGTGAAGSFPGVTIANIITHGYYPRGTNILRLCNVAGISELGTYLAGHEPGATSIEAMRSTDNGDTFAPIPTNVQLPDGFIVHGIHFSLDETILFVVGQDPQEGRAVRAYRTEEGASEIIIYNKVTAEFDDSSTDTIEVTTDIDNSQVPRVLIKVENDPHIGPSVKRIIVSDSDGVEHERAEFIEECLPRDPVYIRWVNRFGGFEYYMFSGFKQFEKAVEDIVNVKLWPGQYIAATQTHQTLGLEYSEAINLGDSGLDQITFNLLSSILTSPYIQIYNTNNARWAGVVLEGSHTAVWDTRNTRGVVNFTIRLIDQAIQF